MVMEQQDKVMEQQDNRDGVGWGGAGIGVGSMEGLQGTLCGYMCI